MSFKSRERRRKKRAAQQMARRSEGSSARWWLTPLVAPGVCDRCERRLRVGKDGVYRHEPQELLCVRCADAAGVFYRPSLRWERERGRKPKRPARPRRESAAKLSGWRANRVWMSDEEWSITCEAMSRQVSAKVGAG